MSTQNTTPNNDASFQKGGGQNVAVGNPGMMWDTDVATNLSLATPKRGSSVHSVSSGSGESFTARTEIVKDDHDLMSFQIESPAVVDRVLFIADREMRLISATFRIVTKGGTGHAALLKKADSGTAIGSGTTIAASAAIGSTAAQDTNISAAPVVADAVISAGQSVGIDFSGTPGSAANLTLTLEFRRVSSPERQSAFIE
mgnify:CR=1 FL=1